MVMRTCVVVARRRDVDRGAFRAVVAGVLQQIPERVAELGGVGMHDAGVRRDGDVRPVWRRCRSCGLEIVATPSTTPRRCSGERQRFLSRVEPREPQQIAHEPFHAQRVPVDDSEELPPAPPGAGASCSAST